MERPSDAIGAFVAAGIFKALRCVSAFFAAPKPAGYVDRCLDCWLVASSNSEGPLRSMPLGQPGLQASKKSDKAIEKRAVSLITRVAMIESQIKLSSQIQTPPRRIWMMNSLLDTGYCMITMQPNPGTLVHTWRACNCGCSSLIPMVPRMLNQHWLWTYPKTFEKDLNLVVNYGLVN